MEAREEVLIASEDIPADLLNAFVSLMPDATIVVDREGLIVSMNAGASVLFGYGLDELVGQALETLVPNRNRARHRKLRSNFAASPRNRPMGADLDLAGRRRDGSVFPVDVSLAPIRSGDRDLVVAAVRDATSRRAAMAVQTQLATIVRSSLDAIISMNLGEQIMSWNPAAEELLGYAAEEIVGRQMAVLVPEGATRQMEELLEAARSGLHVSARDTRWAHRDGHEVDVAVSISLLREEDGLLLGFSSIVRDITERKESEIRLRRLLDDERRLERQHAAMSELRLALLSNARLEDSMATVCEQACEVLEVACGLIGWEHEGELRVIGGYGLGTTARARENAVRVGQSFARHVLERGSSVTIGVLADLLSNPIRPPMPSGPALGVPVVTDADEGVVLMLIRHQDRPAFGAADVVYAKALADQAVLALELQRARQDREELVLLSDRERIARDLHDVVIQRLFAAGMGLQSAIPLIEHRRGREKVSQAIDDLDRTISEVRNTIFSISRSAGAEGRLRVQIIEIARQARESLGFDPEVVIAGPVDAAVPDELVPHVLAVAREGLSNAVRHAHATAVRLRVAAVDGEVAVRVSDNGVGIGEIRRESGLSNLRDRANVVGGRFQISANASGGTTIEWRAPTTR